MSRVKAPLSPSTKSEEYTYYESLLQSNDKTLEDVIWAIVEYEYILSRKDELSKELAELGAEPAAIADEIEKWQRYIKERVGQIKAVLPLDSLGRCGSRRQVMHALDTQGESSMMSNCHEAALAALKKFVEQGGVDLTDDDLAIFKKKPDDAQQHNQRLAEISEAVFRGFFCCAAVGEALYPEYKVAERFGNTLEDNYPEASNAFLKFARIYWTLRVLEYELMENDMDWIGAHLLGNLEQVIGPLFFPFPGSYKIPPTKRAKDQRRLLEEFGKGIDVEEFMQGNPILIRDRRFSLWERLKSIFSSTT